LRAASNLRRVLWLAALFGLATGAHAAPKSVTATYDVFMSGARIAVISERFEATDGTYRIVSDSKPVGLAALIQRQPIKLVSTGEVTRRGLRPQQFEGTGRNSGSRGDVSAAFDWPAERLVLKFDGHSETVALPPGTQDRLSIMYQFMYLAPRNTQQVQFAMTNGRKVDRYRYTVTPGVEIETGLGRLSTLHLVKQQEPGDTGTEIWLSPRHGFIPVKLLIVEKDGIRYEQVITKLDVEP
jgi:hypothetical protein